MSFEFFFFFFFFLYFLTVGSAANRFETKPRCQLKCGNVNIPYPFGIGANCSIANWANVRCNTTFNPPKLFILNNLEVLQISLTELRFRQNLIASKFYNQSGAFIGGHGVKLDISNSPYTFSSTKNKITAIGCNTSLKVYFESLNSTSGCYSSCTRKDEVVLEPCSGSGCCEMHVPKGLNRLSLDVNSISNPNHSEIWPFAPYSAAVIGEEGVHKFTLSDFSSTTSLQDIPVVLNFGIGNKTCKAAKKDLTTYVCKENSYCYDAVDATGYLCSCNEGYDGNPYLKQSCQDVNECEDPINNLCDGNCINTLGSYYCSCPIGFYGDGRKDGTHCTKRNKSLPIIPITLGLGLGSLFLLAGGSWLNLSVKKRRLSRIKEHFFEQNGGLLLKQQFISHGGCAEPTKLFTAEELKRATNSYDEHQILGRGGNGTVYKGVLTNQRTVAIKKSKLIDESQLGQFINEVVVLSEINHRNVVKLLGCCLETEVPLLVYEYVAKGTLYDHLHKKDASSSFSWADRMRIAAESAGAVAYLHSAASIPIIHRDIKSANILLDDHYTAKVADFGSSRLNLLDETQISTLVQGTMGYLDPEYFQTGQLTEKSDVYSFGVVLAELLTGEKAICFERSQERINLATNFVRSIKEFGANINGTNKEQVCAVADLAKRCLSLEGKDRPAMTEVAKELEEVRGFPRHSSTHESNEGKMTLASEEFDLYAINSDGSTEQYSLQRERIFPDAHAR